MFTLQILDRGQTSLHPLGDRSVLVGSAVDADLRLLGADVLPAHARLVPTDEGPRLIALAKVLVNGRATKETLLALGDRIEIGDAVLVLGRSVERPTRVEEVLAEAAVGRRARQAPRQSGRVRWLPMVGAGALLAVVATFVLQGDDAARVQGELATVARLRSAGDLERASAAIAKLQRAWIDASDDRLQRLAAEQAQLDAVLEAAAHLRAGLLDPAVEKTYAEWSRELQRLEAAGEPAERTAARLVRASLAETLRQRPVRRAAPPPAVPEPQAGVAQAPREGQNASPPPAVPPTPVDPTVSLLADAERLVKQELFAQAIAVLESGLADAESPPAVVRLQARIEEVRALALKAMTTLLADSRRRLAAGSPREALTMLAAVQHRWPSSAEFRPLAAALREAEAAIAAAERKHTAAPTPAVTDEVARQATLSTLRAHLDAVRQAEERGAFAESVSLLREAAGVVRERDADFAARLEVRAAEAELLAAWHAGVAAALPKGARVPVVLQSGRTVELGSVQGEKLVGNTVEGEVRVGWHEIPAAGVKALAEAVRPVGPAALGAATLLYRAGERAAAEALLAKVATAEASLKEAVDRVLARGRGDAYDPRGYVLGKDGFVAARTIEAQRQAQKLGPRLEAVLRGKDAGARETFVTDVLAQGPEALDALLAAVQKEFRQKVERVDGSSLKKQVDRLEAQRVEVDRARQHARDLIYDEVKYFYPYKPPAVSGERFAEYNRVQAEVDRRVAALHKLWSDDRLRIKVPATLREDLERLDWLAQLLAELGDTGSPGIAAVDWARALPAGESIGLRDYCRTPAERLEVEEWRRIEAYNTIVQKQVSSAVREQLQITNEYRAMFRHRPLALVAKVCTAAQGHAEEMSRLGYFAHMSPTPGRRTPYDRMQLAGYQYGVSENIALVDSASGAHNAWCHSSGHHRNLLNPQHRECGIGADGRYWVQNFGSGSTFQDDAAWSQACGGGKPGRR